MSWRACLLAGLVGCFSCVSFPAAAEPPLKPFRYQEGFEGDAPKVELWAKNGTTTVHTLAPSDEQAFEGRRSLKLDVTLDEATYGYWGVRVKVPCAGRLKISARLFVAEGTTASVGFGTNVVYPPTRHSGCGSIDSFREPTGGWKEIQCDLVARGRDGANAVIANYAPTACGDEVGAVLDRWALFVKGRKGQRVVAYLDDVRIEGEVPSQADFDAEVRQRWAKAQERFQGQVAAWRRDLAAGQKALDAIAVPKWAAGEMQSVHQTASRARELLDRIAKAGYGSRGEVDDLESAFTSLRCAPQTFEALARNPDAPFLLYTPRAITNQRLSLESFPPPAPLAKELTCSGCRGEYESLSAAVFAAADIRGMTVSVGDLEGPGGRIPAEAVDVRVVKCWFQSGRTIGFSNQRLLVPELLLKDDRLVEVDMERKTNSLRSTADGKVAYVPCSGPTSEELEKATPRDAQTLQPVDIPAHRVKQFWFTVHIPENAKAGAYRGIVRFRNGAGVQTLPLAVTVHPFDLAPSRVIYSIYYRGRLSVDGKPTISSERKSEQQYRVEMANLKSHGVLYPTNYQGLDATWLKRTLEIRREAGLPGGPLYSLGLSPGTAGSPKQLEALKQRVKQWQDFCRPYGYDTIYAYGTDEAKGERLLAQKAAWKAVQEAGAKTFVACYKGTFEAMGDLLNCAVLAGRPDPEEARKWHSVGAHAFCYAYPQVGHEEPETYRRNFGLVLWKAGFDGAMDYAYQHGFGHIWNDFDSPKYRDHVFTYPTVDGVIDTIQWEGFREAVDDVRYLTTLGQRIEKAKTRPAAQALAGQAASWIESLDDRADLDQVRVQAVEWILKLSEPNRP